MKKIINTGNKNRRLILIKRKLIINIKKNITRKKSFNKLINKQNNNQIQIRNFRNSPYGPIKAVIVCVAKLEKDYIEEFVKYHLALGFDTIYIYDNEEIPTYKSLLNNYGNKIVVIHNPKKPIQYEALRHFEKNFMYNNNITHVAHIDVDEFICLKMHKNIKEFIKQYIIRDCAGIGMNWRFFGSSGRTEKENLPLTDRFIMCEKDGNAHIKTLYNVHFFNNYQTVHDIVIKPEYPNHHIKSTNGTIIRGPFNYNIDQSVIQLNHYKTKTFPEFNYIRSRGYADAGFEKKQSTKEIEDSFKTYDKNDVRDMTAYYFYKTIV